MEGSVFSVFGDWEIWKWEKKKEKENEGRGIFYTRYNTSCTFRLRNEIGLIQHASPRLRNESNTHTSRHAKPRSRESQNHLTHSLKIP